MPSYQLCVYFRIFITIFGVCAKLFEFLFFLGSIEEDLNYKFYVNTFMILFFKDVKILSTKKQCGIFSPYTSVVSRLWNQPLPVIMTISGSAGKYCHTSCFNGY